MGRRVVRKPVIGLALLWCAGIEISRLWSYKATHVESSNVKKPVKENKNLSKKTRGRAWFVRNKTWEEVIQVKGKGKRHRARLAEDQLYMGVQSPDQSPELALKNHEFNFPDP